LSKIIEPLRGVHDMLPAQAAAWQFLESTTREVFASYGYEEFRVPIIEQTQLFKRSIGDFTDIVEKEMFSFIDQGEDHITLRPEATAGIARAMISNGLLRENRLRVWCMGPMFRRERPQAGRYRQFHQIDAEAFGFAGPDVDAEIILLAARLLRRAPLLVESLDAESKAHFAALCAHLKSAGIEYHVNPRLVRGLDYYTRTVFEWITDSLGSQSTVCAGGRYDGLIAQLGGTATPGIGWAMGQERIVMLLEKMAAVPAGDRPQVYLVAVGERSDILGLQVAERLRDIWPALRLQFNLGGGNFKAQFKRADKSGARYAIIVGDDEAARGVVALKDLRGERPQEECAIDRIGELLGGLLGLEA
jgi:histidyl-tRNA synthetase